MAVKELYTASERWFTEQAISRSLLSKDQVSKAVADQLDDQTPRRQIGPCLGSVGP